MMLFKPELIEQIVKGNKTQTRRPVKAGEEFRQQKHFIDGWQPVAVVQNNRIKMATRRDYAVCPGRGKPCVLWNPSTRSVLKDHQKDMQPGTTFKPLRIRVLDIRREDVRDISLDDAIAEGFQSVAGFLLTWCGFYDRRVGGVMQKDGVALWVDGAGTPYASDVVDFGEWLIANRPDELYQAWAYTFEIVR